MAGVRLLRRAEQDLVAIATYTTRQFGVEQAHRYRDGLLTSLGALAAHPKMGSDQGHIRAHLRRHVHQSHAIYYRAVEGGVIVLRILGPGQDPLGSL